MRTHNIISIELDKPHDHVYRPDEPVLGKCQGLILPHLTNKRFSVQLIGTISIETPKRLLGSESKSIEFFALRSPPMPVCETIDEAFSFVIPLQIPGILENNEFRPLKNPADAARSYAPPSIHAHKRRQKYDVTYQLSASIVDEDDRGDANSVTNQALTFSPPIEILFASGGDYRMVTANPTETIRTYIHRDVNNTDAHPYSAVWFPSRHDKMLVTMTRPEFLVQGQPIQFECEFQRVLQYVKGKARVILIERVCCHKGACGASQSASTQDDEHIVKSSPFWTHPIDDKTNSITPAVEMRVLSSDFHPSSVVSRHRVEIDLNFEFRSETWEKMVNTHDPGRNAFYANFDQNFGYDITILPAWYASRPEVLRSPQCRPPPDYDTLSIHRPPSYGEG